jgi:2',3'-cyclic-nucleotide 2'-phosphodiesterase (5'-nucleotidase family)
VETLNRIGVEFNAVGNHEFDHGSAELLRLQSGGCKITAGAPDPTSCQGALVGTPVPFEGAKFQWLAANAISQATGQPLLPAYGVKTFDGVRVAFVGVTLEGTPTIVTPSGVEGLQFRNDADTVNALVPQLRRRGIEAIVLLVHQGGFQSAGVSDIDGCDGDLPGTDIAEIVSRLDDAVDLAVTGHTHAAYNCSADTVDVKLEDGVVTTTPRPTGLANAAGCRGQAQTRILIPAKGLEYTWDAARGCDERIRDLRLVDAGGAPIEQIVQADGTLSEPGRTYRVTINNFLATGGDGFTSFTEGTAALGGAQDIDALTDYLGRFEAPSLAPYDPAAPALLKPRIVRVN